MVRAGKCRRGLSLTEVIIVVAIMAVLVAIFVPTLSRAREASRRTVCAGNLRQMNSASSAYALSYENRFILGHWSERQLNYVMYVGNSGSYDNSYYHPDLLVLWGRYYKDGFILRPQAVFCPSNQDPVMQLNATDNPWPPGTANSRKNTRAAYGTRPENGMDWFNTMGAVNGMPTTWPNMYNYTNKAVAADIVSAPSRVNAVHGDGVNVSFGDGSVKWVARKIFNANLQTATEIFSSSSNNAMLNPTNSTGIWYDLDKSK